MLSAARASVVPEAGESASPAGGAFRLHRRGRAIGLLGGTFDPVHAGHLHLARHAVRSLGLDEVWWIVSWRPTGKTPLAPFARRLAALRRITAANRRWRALDIEARWRITSSRALVHRLVCRTPGARFVWLLGADSFATLHDWQRWRELCALVPMAVIPRDPPGVRALAAPAARCVRRVPPRTLVMAGAPAWSYVPVRKHPLSSTGLRTRPGPS